MRGAGLLAGNFLLNGPSFLSNFGRVASTVFPNAAAAINNISVAFASGAGAASKFSVAVSGLWRVIAAHPIVSTVAAIGIAYSLFDAFTVSADEAREKLNNLKSEYSNNESELSSVNSELSVTQDRIDELKAKGTLILTEQSELENLQKQNLELERQKSILESIQKLKKQEIYDSFVETMNKDVDNVLEYQGWGGEGPIFNSDRQLIEWELNNYKRYVNAIAELDKEYQDNLTDPNYQSQREKLDNWRRESLQYLLDKNKDFIEASKNISYIPDPKNENDRRVNEWLNYIGDFQDSLSMLVGDNDAKLQAFIRIVTTEFNGITASLQELGKQSGVTAEMLQDSKYDDFINKMIDLGVISGKDTDNLQILADSFNNLDRSIKSSAGNGVISSFESLTSGLEEQSNRISTVQTAISESLGDTGLSTDSVNNIKKMYSGLEGYDPSSLFVRTALGIKLNTNALQELEQEYQNVERQKYIDRLVELQNQYDRASRKLRTLKDDTVEYNNTIDRMTGLNNEINAIKDMVSQYDALYSAYNRWVNAKNQPHNRDSYEGVGASYDAMEQLIKDGWVGDTELGAYLDLMLGSSRTGDAITDWQKLGQTIEGTTHSLKDYWVTGENGNLQSDGLFTFLDDVNQKLGEQYVAIDALGNYKFDFSGDKLQAVAEAFGTSTDMVLLFTQAMQDAGIAVEMNNLGDNNVPKKQQEDNSQNASDSTPTVEVNGEMVDVDTSGVEPVEVEVIPKIPEPGPDDNGDSSSQSMSYGSSWDTNGDGEPDKPIDVPAELVAEEVNTSELDPAPLEIDPEVPSGESSDIVENIQDVIDSSEPITVEALIDKQLAFASAEEMQAGVEQIGLTIPFLASVDPDQARAQLEEMSSQLSGSMSENAAIKFLLSLDDVEMMAQLTAWRDQLSSEEESDIEITPKVTSIDTSEIDPIEEDATAKFTADMSAVPKHVDITGTVHFNPTGIPSSRGIGLAGGTDDAKGGETLVGELGRELVVRDDRFQTVGDNGAELVNLKPGDIVFNHEDTEKILNGKSGARGTALANGTISGPAKAYVSKDILIGGSSKTSIIGPVVAAITGIGQSLKDRLAELRKKSDQEKKPNNGGGGGGGTPAAQDEKLEKVDWIERAIKKIEREIDKLKKTATSTFKSLGSKMTAASNEIAKITEEIELQGKAAERYRQEAESVELDEGLKQKVRDGTIDIQDYNEETRKLIDDYKKWIDKSYECEDALTDLHDALATVYEDNFNAIKSDFDNQLGFIEHDAKAIEHNIDMLEAKGYMSSTRYYEQMQQNNRKTLDTLNAEMAALEQSLADAVSSGEIEEGSEAWYSMKNAVNETQEKIDDTNLSMQEIANTIRQIQWDYFDFGSQKISALADEAEFLINLMSGSELFDKQGKVSDTGLASMGLHGERYNVFMADADRYAEEIKKLDEEIANDPHNTTLLERRQELIDAQRESILTANDEKTAIRDLVKQGIDLELQAMQDLIDKYSESLDAAKDLYDYQKKVKSQADDIKNIQKQLAAYENDLSEEARAKVQKLTVSLQDAQDKLNETEYQQYIADQKKLLNDLYSDYEQVLNERLDDLDALVADVIAQVNKSSADICDTLGAEAGKVGYSIEDATKNIWNGSSIALDGALTTYGNDFSAKLTGVNASLSNILNAVVAMAEHSNAITEGSIPRYKKGGLANYTGLAYMDGTSTDPEIVLDARDSANLIALRDLMRRNPDFSRYTGGGMPAIDAGSDIMRLMGVLSQMSESGTTFGDTNIYIDIDHVENYNDFVNKLREDPNFDKMVRAMTTDRLMGGSPMAKTKYRW